MRVCHLPVIQLKSFKIIVWFLITNIYFWLREFSFRIKVSKDALGLDILQFKYHKLKKVLKAGSSYTNHAISLAIFSE
jgi:hypothetical protein